MLCSCLVINDRNVTVLVHMCLQVLGNHTEFQRVASLLQDTVDFDIDVNASVFETNIRGARGGCRMFLAQPRPSVCVCRSEPSLCACVSAVVGGLLSAHLLAGRAGMELEPGWPCSGPLLRMAEDAARKLLPGMNRSVNGDVIREQSVFSAAPHLPNTTNKQTNKHKKPSKA